MKKILCIAAVLVLAGGVASAKTIARAAPSEAEVRQLASLDAQGSLTDHGSNGVADSYYIGVTFDNTALFMGDAIDVSTYQNTNVVAGYIGVEMNDGLLKGPMTYALDFYGQKTNLSAATEVVNLANTGKTLAIFMGDDTGASPTPMAAKSLPPPTSYALIVTIAP